MKFRHLAIGATVAALTALAITIPSSTAQTLASTSCDGLSPGSYIPTAATTGVKTGSSLTRVNPPGGVLSITTPGTVIENADVWGQIKVRAANVVIRNSIVRGTPTAPTSSSSLVTAWDAPVSGLVLEGVQLRPQTPSLNWSGINGHDYVARCVDVSETVDGFGAFNTNAPTTNTNVKITQSYCHDLAGWSPSADRDNRSHTDCLQAQGARGIEVSYNNFSAMLSRTVGTLATNGYAGCSTCVPAIPADPGYIARHPQALSAIMINDINVNGTRYMPAGWVVKGNRFTGGEITINGGDDDITSTNLGTMCGNTFEDNAFYPGHSIDLSATIAADTCDADPLRRNSWAHPVTVRHRA